MAVKVVAATLLMCFGYASAATCTLEGFTVDSLGTVWAAGGGHYAGVKTETIVTAKTAFPTSMTGAGFSTIDAFSCAGATCSEIYFAKGDKYMSITSATGAQSKAPTAMPANLAKEIGTPVTGFSITSDGTTYIMKGGYYMGEKAGVVTQKKTALPTTVSSVMPAPQSMAISPDGLNVYFTQGPYYMGVSTAAGNAVTTTKRCFPTELTRNGFDSVDGMTIDGAGNVYVAKGSHYMGVKGGSVVQKKTVHLKAATDLIGTSLDALSVSPDGTVIIVKGAEYVSVKGGVVVGGKKNAVPAEITKAGFSTIQGLSITGDGSVYVAAAGQYMSVDKNGAVKDKKQAFPSSITSAGFSNLDGFHIAADGSVIVAKDAYYMVVSKNNVVTTKKSPLPSSIMNELCGSSAYCVGPVGASGAPTMYGMATSVAGAGQGTTAKAGLPRSLFALPMLMLAAAAML